MVVIALNHANNLIGTYNDIEKIGKLAREKNLLFLVDVAQSVGKMKVHVGEMKIDILCAPGHKSLYGLSGTGFIYLGDRAKKKPFLYGGTGSFSDQVVQPELMPDMLEVGTLNVVGIKSLYEGIQWIHSIGMENISEKEIALTHYIIKQLEKIPNVEVYTPFNKHLAGIVLFNLQGMDSSYVAGCLDSQYGIATRAGLHCNPLGHKYLGTLEKGAVRVSVSYFNHKEEVDDFIKAIEEMIHTQG